MASPLAENGGLPPGGDKDEDPEKKRKKEEKAREKEAKKAKAAAKAAAASSKPSEPSKRSQEKAKKAAIVASAAPDGDTEDPPTEPGCKKNLSSDLAKAYNPRAVEASWYEWWQNEGFFNADNKSDRPVFSIVVPPPNVTGALHIGHALTAAVQDTVVRWRRMSGYNVCWVPGVDHAGIATQVVVEKKIMRDRGQTRHDVGREPFVAEVWKWKNAYGDRIMRQQRRMGASLDWSRECFTMDEKLSKAVTEAFIRLHSQGLIYRDNRLVNWDCVLRTAVSDIEVDYRDIPGRAMLAVPGYDKPVEFGVITSFAYPLASGDGEIVVATTRLETMLGDTAVAVHPEDPRYKHLHGELVVHPFNGRRIPIVCDAELVDMAFGTGAVKITPAHDPNDFATGKRHNLQFINMLTDDGRINSNGGPQFEGMKRFEARTAVKAALEAKGLYRGVADNPMRLGLCSRTKDVIEPMIKPQWYVDCREAAAESCRAVRDGRLRIVPKFHEDTWFRWLENIRDWCISRQLWWGHRIPAWYAVLEGDERTEMGSYDDHWAVAHDEGEARALAAARHPGARVLALERDPDVLDTWFSSGLFPFSVFGWPDAAADVAAFYPTSLLETGHDILFFWVARMVMLGLRLTGQVPFKEVFLHAMVRDAHGRKMSKSLGNVIDPLEVIEGIALEALHAKLLEGNLDPREVERARAAQREDFPAGIPECGCDALRFALVSYTAQGVNINLDIQRVFGYRLWCNKLWNAIRFALLNLGHDFRPSPPADLPPFAARPFACRWVLSCLGAAAGSAATALEAYEFSEATTAVYSFWQYRLCDVFIELAKPALGGDDGDENAAALKKITRETLWTCLEWGLRLLHPFMPFVTEELWQRLPKPLDERHLAPSICVAPYPAPVEEWDDSEAVVRMAQIESVVKAVRTLRVDYGLQSKQRPDLFLHCKSEAAVAELRWGVGEIATLAAVSNLQLLGEGQEAPLGCAVAVVNEQVSVHLLLRGVVNAGAEISKLQKKIEETQKMQEMLLKKMQAAGYQEKSPPSVQEENTNKAAKLAAELESLDDVIKNFERLAAVDSADPCDPPPDGIAEKATAVEHMNGMETADWKDPSAPPAVEGKVGVCCWDCGH